MLEDMFYTAGVKDPMRSVGQMSHKYVFHEAQWLNRTTQMEPPYSIEEVVCVFVKTVIHMVFSQGARL